MGGISSKKKKGYYLDLGRQLECSHFYEDFANRVKNETRLLWPPQLLSVYYLPKVSSRGWQAMASFYTMATNYDLPTQKILALPDTLKKKIRRKKSIGTTNIRNVYCILNRHFWNDCVFVSTWPISKCRYLYILIIFKDIDILKFDSL